MNVRRKVFVWYTLSVTIVIGIVIAAGAVIFFNTLDPVESSPTALWVFYAVVTPLLIVGSVIGAHLISKKYLEPLHVLKNITVDAEHRPISNAFPSLNINVNNDVSSAVTSIHGFMKQRHEKLQQVIHFSSVTSHELRTPLTIIRNQLEDGLQADAALPYLKDIIASTYDEVIRLHHLVNDLLTISTIQAGTLKLEKSDVEFHTFIKEFYDEALFLSREKNISVILARGPQVTVQCDPRRLRQLFFNLFENALKFTPEQGRIHISYRTVNGALEFKISDTGYGVPHHQLDRIFEPFYQVSRHDQEVHKGTGLGLSLVRWIVEAHNGRIDVESEEGKGTTFTIRLPLTDD